MKEEPCEKLYMKWWFWVVIGFMFVSVIFAIAPYPNEEMEYQLIECQELLYEWDELWYDYDTAMYDYCELDSANPLCESYT